MQTTRGGGVGVVSIPPRLQLPLKPMQSSLPLVSAASAAAATVTATVPVSTTTASSGAATAASGTDTDPFHVWKRSLVGIIIPQQLLFVRARREQNVRAISLQTNTEPGKECILQVIELLNDVCPPSVKLDEWLQSNTIINVLRRLLDEKKSILSGRTATRRSANINRELVEDENVTLLAPKIDYVGKGVSNNASSRSQSASSDHRLETIIEQIHLNERILISHITDDWETYKAIFFERRPATYNMNGMMYAHKHPPIDFTKVKWVNLTNHMNNPLWKSLSAAERRQVELPYLGVFPDITDPHFFIDTVRDWMVQQERRRMWNHTYVERCTPVTVISSALREIEDSVLQGFNFFVIHELARGQDELDTLSKAIRRERPDLADIAVMCDGLPFNPLNYLEAFRFIYTNLTANMVDAESIAYERLAQYLSEAATALTSIQLDDTRIDFTEKNEVNESTTTGEGGEGGGGGGGRVVPEEATVGDKALLTSALTEHTRINTSTCTGDEPQAMWIDEEKEVEAEVEAEEDIEEELQPLHLRTWFVAPPVDWKDVCIERIWEDAGSTAIYDYCDNEEDFRLMTDVDRIQLFFAEKWTSISLMSLHDEYLAKKLRENLREMFNLSLQMWVLIHGESWIQALDRNFKLAEYALRHLPASHALRPEIHQWYLHLQRCQTSHVPPLAKKIIDNKIPLHQLRKTLTQLMMKRYQMRRARWIGVFERGLIRLGIAMPGGGWSSSTPFTMDDFERVVRRLDAQWQEDDVGFVEQLVHECEFAANIWFDYGGVMNMRNPHAWRSVPLNDWLRLTDITAIGRIASTQDLASVTPATLKVAKRLIRFIPTAGSAFQCVVDSSATAEMIRNQWIELDLDNQVGSSFTNIRTVATCGTSGRPFGVSPSVIRQRQTTEWRQWLQSEAMPWQSIKQLRLMLQRVPSDYRTSAKALEVMGVKWPDGMMQHYRDCSNTLQRLQMDTPITNINEWLNQLLRLHVLLAWIHFVL